MAIDPYAHCPGGTGKKVKFCCPDMLGDLDKVIRMFEGDQRAACLETIERLETKFPQRACLMSIKSIVQAQLGEIEKAEQTVASFVEQYPGNPVALGESAMLKATRQDVRGAVDDLQKALEAAGNNLPQQVFDAIIAVGQGLMLRGEVLSGRGHLTLALGIIGTGDERLINMLSQFNGDPRVPLLAKIDLPLVHAPADAAWKSTFEQAFDHAARGQWRVAERQWTELAQKAGDWPEIWRNIASTRVWLAETAGAVEALRKYAAQKISPDDAIEAEALAQWLERSTPTDVVLESLLIEYPVRDLEKLQAVLAADKRLLRIQADLPRVSGDEPPPRAAYFLLDKPQMAADATLTGDAPPSIVGRVLVYGKQTDRDARIEVIAYRGAEETTSREQLAAVAGDTLGPPLEAKVYTTTVALQHLLAWNWVVPDSVTDEQRTALHASKQQRVLLEEAAKLPIPGFGGKSITDLAADPQTKLAAQAGVLALELSVDSSALRFDANQLRGKLGLPATEPIDPTKVASIELPLVRLQRLEVGKLSDNNLLEAYQRADHFHHAAALRTLAHEVATRPSLEQKVDRAEAYGILAQLEPNPAKAIELIEKARTAARQAGASCGPWDIAELTLRLSTANLGEAERLLRHLQTDHAREQNVQQALYRILLEAGVINSDGTPAGRPQPAASAAPSLVVPGGSSGGAASGGKLWTPGGEQPAAGKKSALWTPD